MLTDDPSQSYAVARDALAVIYLLWVMTPLLGFQLNESYDLTRLFVYPISPTRLFTGSLLGGLMDRPVLLLLPVLGVLLALFSPTPLAFVFSLLLLLLFLLHTLALGQALMLALIGFLRSRRFRDVTIVLFPLLGMGYYLGQRLLFQQMERGQLTIPSLLDAPGWRVRRGGCRRAGPRGAWTRPRGASTARPASPSSRWPPPSRRPWEWP